MYQLHVHDFNSILLLKGGRCELLTTYLLYYLERLTKAYVEKSVRISSMYMIHTLFST